MTVSLDLAIAAIKAGRKEEGRQLLNLLIQQDPNAELAWLWMSSVVRTDEQRARCLYHVLSINPKNDLAHRGLEILGITVSDSRPVKVPRDSEPIHIPQPSLSNGTQTEAKPLLGQQAASPAATATRRPFLIDPQTITAELPFVPVKPSIRPSEEVQASPNILALEVDDSSSSKKAESNGKLEGKIAAASGVEEPNDAAAMSPVKAAVASGVSLAGIANRDPGSQLEQAQTVSGISDQPMPEIAETQTTSQAPDELGVRETASSSESTATEVTAKEENRSNLAQEGQKEPPNITSNGQPSAGGQQSVASGYAQGGDGMPPPGQPFETRPSQPVPINYPIPNMGHPQNEPTGYGPMPPDQPYQLHGAGTLPMPHYPMMPASIPVHGSPTMGMTYGHYHRHPSEPVPVIIHPGSIFPPQAYPPGPSFHSSATTLMPTFSEAGMPSHMAQGQAIPTASGAAMPLQNMGWGLPPEFQPNTSTPPFPQQGEDEDEEAEEINLLAVIIFGTLSLTALGGIGMLILLFITTSAVPG